MADGMPTSGAQSSNRNIMIVLSYLWLLALIPLVVEKEDKEVQWHAKHGLVLLIAEVILWVVVTAIQMVVGVMLGCVVGLLSLVLWVGILIVHIVAILKGLKGERLIIPGISEYANRFCAVKPLPVGAWDRTRHPPLARWGRRPRSAGGARLAPSRCRASVHARGARHHPPLSGDALSCVRAKWRAVPFHADLQSLRGSLCAGARRLAWRVARRGAGDQVWAVDPGGYGGPAACGVSNSRRPSSLSSVQQAYAPSAVPNGSSTRLTTARPSAPSRAAGR